MGNDANMQTLSGIVSAQGEKLKHKSGGGKLRGGRLFKGDLAGLKELAAARPGAVLPGRAFPAGSQGVGWEKESVWRGRSAGSPWARPRDSERIIPEVVGCGQRRMASPVHPPSPAPKAAAGRGVVRPSPGEGSEGSGCFRREHPQSSSLPGTEAQTGTGRVGSA